MLRVVCGSGSSVSVPVVSCVKTASLSMTLFCQLVAPSFLLSAFNRHDKIAYYCTEVVLSNAVIADGIWQWETFERYHTSCC